MAQTPVSGRFDHLFATDGHSFYEGATQRTAVEFRPTVEAAFQEASSRLPVRVTGRIHWSVVWLDSTHVRIATIDSGYIDPADRQAEIVLQHLDAVASTDLLSGQLQPLTDGRVKLTLPPPGPCASSISRTADYPTSEIPR